MTTAMPLIGDFAVVDTGSRMTRWIKLGETLYSGGFSDFDHAVIASQILPGGTLMIVEAQPGGAVEVPWHYQGRPHLWSTGKVPYSSDAGEASRGYIGTPYSFLDYAAMAAHHFRLPVPGLQAYIASTGHEICSALVDKCYQDAGIQLFDDQRWNGYVTPMDLARLVRA